MEVQIKELTEKVDLNTCYMQNDIFVALKLSEDTLYKIHLGQSYDYSYVRPKAGSDKCLCFSNSLFKKLLLLEGITLNIWRNENNIYLGPVVGVFVSPRRTKTIRIGKPSFCIQKHAEAGSITNCMSYYYSIEGINWDEGKIKGYTFVQSLNKWIHDWFPMPDIIYDRGTGFREDEMPQAMHMRRQFRANNVHFINGSRYLSKWEVYEHLSKYPDAKKYLPETIIYNSFNDVLSMLNEYKFIFVKASVGTQGMQVLSVEQIDKKYKLNFDEDGLKEIIFDEIEDVKTLVEKFLEKHAYGSPFVVQQGIRLIKYNGRNFDIRVLLIKDGQGNWEALQHHCRIAQKNYTITNCHMGADWMNYEMVYPYLSSPFCKRSIPDKEEVVNAALIILHYYQKEFGPIGEVGLDMAVDIYGDIWLIEANRRPDKLYDSSAYDPEAVPALTINIFEYAKFFARFRDRRI